MSTVELRRVFCPISQHCVSMCKLRCLSLAIDLPVLSVDFNSVEINHDLCEAMLGDRSKAFNRQNYSRGSKTEWLD